jgi:hypothetical protein
MDEQQDRERAQPVDKGRRNDPNLRDETASQPGVNSISNSNYDDDNQRTTKTAADWFKTPFGKDADPAYDDIDGKD